MKLVVDTNVLLSALVKNSTTRSLLLNPNHDFYIPEFALDEVEKYLSVISSKSGLSASEIKILFDTLANKLEGRPSERVHDHVWPGRSGAEEYRRKGCRPFLALALNLECDAIWSNDKHLKRQKLVKVWSTLEVLSLLD